jgi:DNA-binding transcriptional LysR family regulator
MIREESDWVSEISANGSIRRRRQHAADAECTTLRLRVQVKSFEAICKMIEAGLGIGIPPKIAAEAFAQKMGLKLVSLADAWAIRQMFVCSKDEQLSVSAQKLVDHPLADADHSELST